MCDFNIRDVLQEKYVAELKRKREKTAAELKDTRDAQREAEKRCRELEEANEAMADDYEGRLQQQVGTQDGLGIWLMAPTLTLLVSFAFVGWKKHGFVDAPHPNFLKPFRTLSAFYIVNLM